MAPSPLCLTLSGCARGNWPTVIPVTPESDARTRDKIAVSLVGAPLRRRRINEVAAPVAQAVLPVRTFAKSMPQQSLTKSRQSAQPKLSMLPKSTRAVACTNDREEHRCQFQFERPICVRTKIFLPSSETNRPPMSLSMCGFLRSMSISGDLRQIAPMSPFIFMHLRMIGSVTLLVAHVCENTRVRGA